MAVYNEILAGRFNRAIQKLLAMKGGPPVRQVASELVFIHPFLSGAENRYLEGWQLVAGVYTATGPSGAGQNTAVRFRNPAGSNVILCVTFVNNVDVVASAAGALAGISKGATNADLTNVLTAPATLDPRGNPNSVVRVSSQVNAPGLPIAIMFFSSGGAGANDSGVTLTNGNEFPVLPGEAFQVFSSATTGSQPTISVLWRERFLEDSERF